MPEEIVTAVEGGHITDVTASNRIIRELVEARQQARACCEGSRMSCTDSSTKATLFPEPDEAIEDLDLDLDSAEPLPGAFDGSLPTGGEPPAERLLERAVAVIRQRRQSYGPPREHFAKTVAAINAIFAHKLREPLTVADWAQIMILDKLARHQGTAKTADTPIDLAGYAACLAECEEC